MARAHQLAASPCFLLPLSIILGPESLSSFLSSSSDIPIHFRPVFSLGSLYLFYPALHSVSSLFSPPLHPPVSPFRLPLLFPLRSTHRVSLPFPPPAFISILIKTRCLMRQPRRLIATFWHPSPQCFTRGLGPCCEGQHPDKWGLLSMLCWVFGSILKPRLMQTVNPPAHPRPAGEVEVTLPVPRIRPFTCRGHSGRGKFHTGCYATEGKSQSMTACGEAELV